MGLETRNATVRFGATTAVDDVSLSVATGEVYALLGASGSGKSTLLRAIAGLEPCTGDILWDGESVVRVPPHRRGFGLMFQDGQLFPHLDVAGNVGYGLRVSGTGVSTRGSAATRPPKGESTATRPPKGESTATRPPKGESTATRPPKGESTATRPPKGERVGELLELVGLAGFEMRRVTELSGGEQQRVALARSLAASPRLLLLDEPLSSLDRELRERLAGELHDILRAAGTTAILVTHDHDEARVIADRIGVLEHGRLVDR